MGLGGSITGIVGNTFTNNGTTILLRTSRIKAVVNSVKRVRLARVRISCSAASSSTNGGGAGAAMGLAGVAAETALDIGADGCGG